MSESFESSVGIELDLHTFQPKDVESVVEEYLWAAAQQGLRRVRIIHGKGIGYQREVVRRVALNSEWVASIAADPTGNWGSTDIILKGIRA